MTAVKSAFSVITFAVILSDVTSWIVDMAEVENLESKEQFDEGNYDDENLSGVASEDDNEIMYTANYAEKFNHETFKKKEVESVIKNGGVYLEGLSDAMSVYRDTLDDCNKLFATQNSSKVSTATPNMPKTNTEEQTKCEKAEKKKYYVQKLSEMALLTTDKLRDKAYENTNKEENDDADLIQLAWTLDKLAYLTGYGSKHGNPVETSSNDSDSSLPTESTGNIEQQTSNHRQQPATEDNKQQQLEILEQVENGRPLPHFPPTPLTDVKSVQKRDTGDIMRYYLKYKVWNGSNPIDDPQISDIENFDVQNSLRVLPIKKRSLEEKKAVHMQSALKKIRYLRCKLKDQSKTSARKLVKSIKVYRRKILKNNNSNAEAGVRKSLN
ncbi:uncharacterized protein LOC120634999 [Pararge aegeria]|uniref:uncharacterized protein LOC120634999 n=1 Tax=Pararge aegeria TaxID=116150 RepID=UPI0019D017AF|nr:uncharacterized protein LOC120634999 [Pararge aegeria]